MAKSNSVLQMSLSLYRQTLKRVRWFHAGLHGTMAHLVIPLLERIRDFRTMPDDPFWFRIELLTERHEPETTTHLTRLIEPGMTVLDIGAHVGYYTRLASDRVGHRGRVIAFEPHPRNHAYLTRNVGKRGNIDIFNLALAEQEGTAELYDYLMMSASGSLHYDESLRDVQMAQVNEHDIAPRIGARFQPQTFTVRTAPVDDLLAEYDIQQVDVIKMDIEGAELGALRGMTQTVARSPRLSLVMEYNPLGLRAFGNDPLDALREVLALGFTRLYVIEADARLTDYTDDFEGLAQLTDQLEQTMGVVNLLLQRH